MRASYWQDDAQWCDRWADTPLPEHVDHAVIGGGISGVSTALRLAELEPTATIALLEATRIGGGASGRNAGFLSPVAAPVWLLGADRDTDKAWAIRSLNRRLHQLVPWIRQCAPGAELESASLSIESASRVTDAGLEEFAHALDIAKVGYRRQTSRLRRRRTFLGMDAFVVHPYKLVRDLAESAAARGVLVRERATITAIESHARGATLRLAAAPPMSAARVVICTNAETATLGLTEPIDAQPVYSHMIATAPLLSDTRRRLVRDADFTVELNASEPYHRMHADRLLYGGIDRRRPPESDFAVPSAVRRGLERRLKRSFPDVSVLPITHAWSGAFHATRTGLPLIFESRRNPAIVWNVGYGGTGLALAMICAPLVARLAMGAALDIDDERLLASLSDHGLPLRDGARALARLGRRLLTLWR